MSIIVRRAGAGDLQDITECNIRIARETEHFELDPDTVLEGVRQALADEQKAIYFVAESDGAFAGQLMVTHEWSDWRNGDIWWIQSVYVKPEFRRMGVFSRLYEYTRMEAEASGAVGLRLYVEKANSPAQSTYTRQGMIDAGYIVMEQMFRACVITSG